MSLAPDAGMSQLAADLARRSEDAAGAAAGMPPAAPGGGGASLDLEVMGRLAVALDGNAAELRASRAAARIPWEACHPVPLNPITVNAAGAVADERWEPREGWFWHITRVSVQSLAASGATSALAALDSLAAGAANLQSFPPAGATATAGAFLGCWEPKGLIIGAGQRLMVSGTGGGFIANGQAIEIAADWLPTYLM